MLQVIAPEPKKAILRVSSEQRVMVVDQPRRGSIVLMTQKPHGDKWIQTGQAEITVGELCHALGWTPLYVKEQLLHARKNYEIVVEDEDDE